MDNITNGNPPWPTATAASIADAMRAAKARLDALPQPEFDCLVFTQAAWDAVRRQFREVTQSGYPVSPLGSLPVQVRDTEEEAAELCKELKRAGRRPRLYAWE